ncbi:DUF1735 domain-containing protein [Bacteroides sp. 224]|uniref:DUF1735 domain-containing protein n=1 Tax=Bacteroides sp. 224 TaxID=2302936 RepID=UPI0013D3CA8F|nr:DUF1735 domain-containing protein [Bacteroides sp. 224]NDV64621.1 DUF1735 domain-containing protein [Bacteroides sp. 224]
MKNRKLRKIAGLLAVVGVSFSFLAGCSEDINDFEKQTAAEASNKVFISEQYALLSFDSHRTIEGEVSNMDTLIAKLVVNCTSPAGNDLKVKIAVDTLLVDVYNRNNETSYNRLFSNWVKLNKSTLTIPEGSTESSDTLTIAITRALKEFVDTNGYIVPLRITSAWGYDAQMDYAKRTSYLAMNVIQENGVGFEEGKNNLMVVGDATLKECTIPMVAYMASDNDINVSLEVDNSEVAAFNSQYGTDFKAIPATDWDLAELSLPAGSTSANGKITYKGDASQLAGSNYLVPIKIKSVDSPGAAEPVKTMVTDTYYLLVNSISDGCTLETSDTGFGTKQTDRKAYNVIPAGNYSLMTGKWNDMFSGGFWVTKATATLTIDLGSEISNITGLHIVPNNKNMAPKNIDFSYAGEKMYNETSGLSVSLGSLNPSGQANMYFKFAKPVTARYIRLGNMIPASGYTAFTNFFIYTAE